MPATALIQKPIASKSIDVGLCKRLVQEACRRASAAESWATLVFDRLNRKQIALDLPPNSHELAEQDAAELRRLTSVLAYELKS